MMVNSSTFVIFGGFYPWWNSATNATFVLDTSKSASMWKRVDDVPIPQGLTHGAHIVRQSKIYNCGGYIGGHPGPHTSMCIVYDSLQRKGKQWSTVAPLPQGRGAGGMFYSTALDAMFYVSGAQRFLNNGTLTTVDYNTTWMYSFTGPTAKKWVRKADLPYASNHMMAVTAKDATGKERHYAFGGQYKENEYGGNYAIMYEYNAVSNKWTKQSNLPFARAHATISTRAIGCGIVVVGGNTNGGQILANVTYYHIPSNAWIQLGSLPVALNTPVCDVNRWTSVLHCETGKLGSTHSYQRQLLL
jgi:hypothetical protein